MFVSILFNADFGHLHEKCMVEKKKEVNKVEGKDWVNIKDDMCTFEVHVLYVI